MNGVAADPRPCAEALFTRYHAAVYRFFRRMTGRSDRAEELAQEVFVRALRALPTYEARGFDGAWIFQIARHLLGDERRSAARRAAATTQIRPVLVVPPRQHLHLALDRALQDIEALDREVFLLREVAGFGYDAIAASTGLTSDAVRNRIRRTRVRLQAVLRGELRDLRQMEWSNDD